MKRILPFTILCLVLLSLPAGESAAQDNRSWDHPAIRYNAWEASLNPTGTYYAPIDSLVEATVGFQASHQALPESDKPDRTRIYAASINGSYRLGRSLLTGGVGWDQSRTDGQEWNFLTQPDHLITIGDTLNDRQRVERYRIYGKAAHALSSRLIAGIGADYMATDNRDRTDARRFSGKAHTLNIDGGLIYTTRDTRLGLALHYTRRMEELGYSSDSQERLYSYPLGYWSSMNGSTKQTQLFSQGNRWGLSLQAETNLSGWILFHDLRAERQKLSDHTDRVGNVRGWDEQGHRIGYSGRFTRSQRRWTHLFYPHFVFTNATADRIIQHASPNASNVPETLTSYRMVSRQQTRAGIRYELARDYTPEGASLSWQVFAGWDSRLDEMYQYPFIQGQYTARFRGEIAFLRTFRLPKAGRLTLHPRLYLISGYGTEERTENVYQGEMSAENKLFRSVRRLSEDFEALTATRLGAGVTAEWKYPAHRAFSAGIRVRASVEQVTSPRRETGGGGEIGLVVWM